MKLLYADKFTWLRRVFLHNSAASSEGRLYVQTNRHDFRPPDLHFDPAGLENNRDAAGQAQLVKMEVEFPLVATGCN